MSGYRVKFRDAAVEDFDDIPGNIVTRIRTAIEGRLAVAPGKYGAALHDDLSGLWKIRVGDFRVVYEIDETRHVVTIWGVQHRRRVYPEMGRRWIRRVK